MRRSTFTPSCKRRFAQLSIIDYLVQTLSSLAHRVDLDMQDTPRRPAITPTPVQFVDLTTPVPASGPWQRVGEGEAQEEVGVEGEKRIYSFKPMAGGL